MKYKVLKPFKLNGKIYREGANFTQKNADVVNALVKNGFIEMV